MSNDSQKSRGTFLVLLALSQGANHGYQIAQIVEQKTQGFFKLSFGALYPILHELEKRGMVKARWEAVGSAKKKKIYTLTAAGQRALKDEREQFDAYVQAFGKLLESKG